MKLDEDIISYCASDIPNIENTFSIGIYKVLFILSVSFSCMAY